MANGCVSGSTEPDLLARRELASTRAAAVNFVYILYNIQLRCARAVCYRAE